MTEDAKDINLVQLHIGSLSDMGNRFADAWKKAEAGQALVQDHITFLSLEAFMAALTPKRLELLRYLRRSGPMSVRRLSADVGRDYKSVHREVAHLIEAGLINRQARDCVAVVWQKVTTELDLAA